MDVKKRNEELLLSAMAKEMSLRSGVTILERTGEQIEPIVKDVPAREDGLKPYLEIRPEEGTLILDKLPEKALSRIRSGLLMREIRFDDNTNDAQLTVKIRSFREMRHIGELINNTLSPEAMAKSFQQLDWHEHPDKEATARDLIAGLVETYGFASVDYSSGTGIKKPGKSDGALCVDYRQKEGILAFSDLNEGYARLLKEELTRRGLDAKQSGGDTLTVSLGSLGDLKEAMTAIANSLVPPQLNEEEARKANLAGDILSQKVKSIAEKYGLEFYSYSTGSTAEHDNRKPSLDFLEQSGEVILSYPSAEAARAPLGAVIMNRLQVLKLPGEAEMMIKIKSPEDMERLERALAHVQSKHKTI